jgi:uncharacterized DUF497 family protein
MQFDDDFDKNKSEWTKKNRGIDFIEARDIWNDPQGVDGAQAMLLGVKPDG